MLMISVIVPVYKVERWLDRCVESILCQTFKDFEVLLIDDGSPDRCGEMCDEWAKKDARICAYHKPNGGLSDARNYGMERAAGRFITFIDSDDYIAPDYLEYLLRLLEEHPSAGYSECSLSVDRNGVLLPRDSSACEKELSASAALGKMFYDDQLFTAAWGKLFKRELMPMFRFPKGRVYEELYVLGKYVPAAQSMVYGGRSLYIYALRDDSITTASFRYARDIQHLESSRIMTDDALRFDASLAPACKRYMAFSRMRLLRQMKNVAPEYFALRKQLRKEVLADALPLLMNPKVPKRDKIGILSLFFGIHFYLWAWNVYTRLRQ